MGFNEQVQAYIVAKYYDYLTKQFGEKGRAAFIHATRYYALQRGRRMAQRAIRDGEALTQANYNYYGEWVSSEEIKAKGIENKSVVINNGIAKKIIQCPWHSKFKEMGMLEAGNLYCTYLDEAISEGFNPKLGYIVKSNLNESDSCIHMLKSGNINEGANKGKNPSALMSFEYHCAHTYWAFHEVIVSIFQEPGEELCQKVLTDFIKEFGIKMAERIVKYKNINFNVILQQQIFG